MASCSDAELELLMADLESDFVERKESAADGRRIRRNICAFANLITTQAKRNLSSRSGIGGVRSAT